MHVRMWQIDTWDWQYSNRPWEVVRRFITELDRVGGGVVLMHDIQQQTVEALPAILDVVRQRGLTVVRETALLADKYLPQSDAGRVG